MAIANKTHWIGVLFLFVASILLLFTTISAPIINHLGLLHVTLPTGSLTQHATINFGTFGYCSINPQSRPHETCTGRHIGYAPAKVISAIDHTHVNEIARGTSDGLTRVMVLHPIECGLAFVAFLTSLGAGAIGSFTGAMVAFIAWVLTLISLAIDFSLFGIIHHHVNHDHSGSRARFGGAIWCLLAAFVLLFFGMLIVFFTCCSKRREMNADREKSSAAPAPRRKKRFGLF